MEVSPFRLPMARVLPPGSNDPKSYMSLAPATNLSIAKLVVYALLVLAAAGAVLYEALPTVLYAAESRADAGEWERLLVVSVVAFGALGGVIHLFSSLGQHVGNRDLGRSWILFYYFRPPVSAALALLTYFVLRVGLLSPAEANAPAAVNVYAILAFAGVTGMFSRQAVEKLAEVFNLLFRKDQETLRADEGAGVRTTREDVAARLSHVELGTASAFGEEEPVQELG